VPKRTAKFDMQRSYRGNIQTINGCICRKRRSNLTCGARFTQTNALGSQLNGSVHLDPAGIILDGGIKPVGWSFDFPMPSPAPEKDTPVVFHLNPAMQTGSCGSLGLGRAELQRHKQVDQTKSSDTSESCIVQRRKVNYMKSSDIISESHEAQW
jgi:hypothetical protein